MKELKKRYPEYEKALRQKMRAEIAQLKFVKAVFISAYNSYRISSVIGLDNLKEELINVNIEIDLYNDLSHELKYREDFIKVASNFPDNPFSKMESLNLDVSQTLNSAVSGSVSWKGNSYDMAQSSFKEGLQVVSDSYEKAKFLYGE